MTRAEAEAELLEIAAPGMGKVGLSIVPGEDGFVASLNTAIRAGFSAVGIVPAARIVSDDDFARVSEADEYRLMTVAKSSIIDLILFRWMKPNEKQNTTSQDWGDLYKEYKELAAVLRAEVAALGAPELTAGRIRRGRTVRTGLG